MQKFAVDLMITVICLMDIFNTEHKNTINTNKKTTAKMIKNFYSKQTRITICYINYIACSIYSQPRLNNSNVSSSSARSTGLL